MRGASWLLQDVKFIRRGGIYPAREPCAAANTPCRGRFHIGPACPAADPCGGCGPPLQTGANIAATRFAWNTKFARRGGIYPARGTLRRRGVRRDEGIPPYVRPGGRGKPIWPVVPGRHVGEGHAPPEPHAAANTPGRCEHRPLHGFAMAAGVEFSRLAAVFPRLRRAGVHARRTVEIQNREHSRRRKHPMCRGRFHIGPACLAADPRFA